MYFKKLTLFFAAILLLSACSDKKSELPSVAASSEKTPALKILETLISHEGINMNLGYIEKQAGPAIRSDDNKHDFEIENCKLQLTTDSNNRSVKHIRLELTPECKVTGERLFNVNESFLLNTITFASFADIYASGTFSVDCLRSCGNAYDPSIYYTAMGSHADNYLTIVLEQPLVTEASIAAANLWADAMEKAEGEDWLYDARFKCEPNKYNDVAMNAMGNIRPQYLSFGNFPKDNTSSCEESTTSNSNLGVVPNPRNECDTDYGKLLKASGFKVNSVAVHGPDEPDFKNWGCPYRIHPAPGSKLAPGSTVTYRFGWEAG